MTNKQSFKFLGLAIAASMILAACAPAAPAATSAPAAPAATEAPAAATEAPATAATEAPAEAAATEAPAEAATEAPTEAAAPTEGGKSLTIGFYQEPSSTYANYSTQTFAAWLGNMTTLGMWYFDQAGAPVLELASEFPSTEKGTISADSKTITYTLRPDLKWSDGEAITSADFKFTWEQIMKPENTGMGTRSGYDQIEKIDTPDATTAVVTFKDVYSPWSTLFLSFQGGLLPMHSLKDLATLDGSPYVTTGAGPFSGPFTIQEVAKGDRIVLAANPNYWRGKPKLDTVNIKIVESREAVLAGLQAGDLDIGPDFAESSIPDLEAIDSLTTLATPGSSFEHYLFNFGKGDAATGPAGPCIFTIEAVRKAIILGIDRFTIADKLLFGKTRVIAGLWPVAPWENTELKPYPYDPEQAKKLLDEAGFKPGADGIRTGQCDGKEAKLSFKHTTTSGNQLRANVQTLVQENLKEIGVEFTPDNKTSDIVFASWTDGGTFTKGEYEMGGYTTGFVAGGDPGGFFDAFKISGIPSETNPAGGNNYHLIDEDLDRLSAEQEKTSDPAKRKEIIDEMQKIMYDKVYVIPMYARLTVDVFNKRVTGIKMVSDNIFDIFTNTWEWDVTQ